MNEEPTPSDGPTRTTRLFWMFGLIAGIVVGTIAAFGIAGAEGLLTGNLSN